MSVLNIISMNALLVGDTVAKLFSACFCAPALVGVFADIPSSPDSVVSNLLPRDETHGKKLEADCMLAQTLVTSASVVLWFSSGASVCTILLMLLRHRDCGCTWR